MANTPVLVRMQLTDFSWSPLNTPDGMSPVEPTAPNLYLWTVFLKVDGSNVTVGPNGQLQQLAGHSIVVPMPGDHGDLGGNAKPAGVTGTISIPKEIATYVTVAQPIPILGFNMSFPGFIACVAFVNSQYDTPDSATSAGHQALNSSLEQQIDSLIPTFGISNPPTVQSLVADAAKVVTNLQNAIINAVKNGLSIWDDLAIALLDATPDALLMGAVFVQFLANAVPAQGNPLQPSLLVNGFAAEGTSGNGVIYGGLGYTDPDTGETTYEGTGTYRLNGLVTADPYPLSLRRVLTGRGYPPPVNLRSVLSGSVQTWVTTP